MSGSSVSPEKASTNNAQALVSLRFKSIFDYQYHEQGSMVAQACRQGRAKVEPRSSQGRAKVEPTKTQALHSLHWQLEITDLLGDRSISIFTNLKPFWICPKQNPFMQRRRMALSGSCELHKADNGVLP
jgi:hypothetical protein